MFDSSSIFSSNTSSFVDSYGLIPRAIVPNPTRYEPPPSPPWLSQTKNVTMNVPFNLKPVIITSGQLAKKKSIVLWQLVPSTSDSWVATRHEQRKTRRFHQVRKLRRDAVGKSYMILAKQRTLKRLQRKPFALKKKQEIYEKWERKELRSQFLSRRRKLLQSYSAGIGNMSFMSGRDGWRKLRESSSSPFQCPLWNCKRAVRVSRKGKFEGGTGSRRSSSRTSNSNLSHRSRSPIRIRDSPLIR